MTPLVLIALLAAPLSSTPSDVVVLPLRTASLEPTLMPVLDNLWLAELSQVQHHRMLSPADIEALLGVEKMRDALGCDDVACATDIAGALGARLVLTATIDRLGDRLIVSSALLDTNQGGAAIARGRAEGLDRPEHVAEVLRHAVTEIFGAAAGGPARRLAQALACLRAEAEACAGLEERAALDLAARACREGDGNACSALAEPSATGGAEPLLLACDAGTGAACAALVRSGLHFERGSGVRLMGWIAGATGAASMVAGLVLMGVLGGEGEMAMGTGSREGDLFLGGLVAGCAGAAVASAGVGLILWGYRGPREIEARLGTEPSWKLVPWFASTGGGAMAAWLW